MSTRYFCRFFLFLYIFWPGALPVIAAESVESAVPVCFSTQWPHDLSELQPDPSVSFGRLQNGFRYILKTNSEPRDRVGVFLNVQAGSIHETDSQRGLAHFLEHMLFNGSTNFEPGQLVEYFQSIGMSFGGDTNAHTTYGETVYKIILPQGEKEDLDEGLLVMSDYARGAMLSESEIERERGVILAEKTARDSASYRAHVASTAFSMKGTMLPERMVIGTENVLMEADRNELKAYYDAWYRPENLVLVMVGDFDTGVAQPLIVKHFGRLDGEGDAPQCPEYGRVEHSGTNGFYHYEPEQGYTDVSLGVVWNKEPENDSFALQIRNIYRFMAAKIMNNRLTKISENPDTPFTSSYYYAGSTLDRFRYAGVRAKTRGDSWRNTLDQLDTIVKQAIRYGFSQEELARVRKDLLNNLENSVLTQETRSSLVLANQIIGNLNSNRVFQSPEQELEMYGPVISGATADQLLETLRYDWDRDVRLVEVVGDAIVAETNASKNIEEYYATLAEKKVMPLDSRPAVNFPYLETALGSAGPGKYEFFDTIGVEKYTYENGIVLNIKRTDFKKESISVAVHFGEGSKRAPLRGIALLSESILNGSGTGTLKKTELDNVLSGSSVQYRFRVGEGSFSWQGYGVADDSELLFQVLQSVILDPGMRKEVYDVAMKKFSLMYQQLDNDVQGGMKIEIEPFLAGNHTAFGLPEWETFQKITLDDVRSWLEPYLDTASLEISVVGDVDSQRIIDLTSQYFGMLPAQSGHNEAGRMGLDFPTGKSLDIAVDSTVNKAAVRMAWPTDDFWDIGRTRRLHVLAAVMDDRLRKIIREKLGASYSPSVYSTGSKSYPGYGVLAAQVIADNESIDLVRQEVLKVAASMVAYPVAQDELERAKGPILTSIKDSLRTNEYWLFSVLSLSSRYPQQLLWPLTMFDDFATVSVNDIVHLATTYLRPDTVATGIVRSNQK